MPTRNQILAMAITGLIVTAIVVGAVAYYTLRIRGTGRIKLIGVKAYSDAELTKEVAAIDWGTIAPGGYSQVTLYLKSTSTAPSNLTLSTEAWEPAVAQNYMTLTWDYDGSTLQPGEVRTVILTLKVSPDISGVIDFAFDIIITAAG